LDAGNSLLVLQQAKTRYGKPEIINSNQANRFACPLGVEYVDNKEIEIRMDGRKRALDNIFIEGLWQTVKRDYVYLNPANDGTELYNRLISLIIATQKSLIRVQYGKFQ